MGSSRKRKSNRRRKPTPTRQPRKTSRFLGRNGIIALLLAVALLGAGLVIIRQHSDKAPYNVVLVVLDTVRRDVFGCYGNLSAITPNMDALAAEGVRFDQAVSTSGWTLPSIGSLITGAWPTTHGGLGLGEKLIPLRAELPCLAEVLQAENINTIGYANAAFVSPMLGFGRGFDLFDHQYAYNWGTRRADETVRGALGQLRQRSQEGNFVFIHLFDPHLDYDPPPGFLTKFTGGRQVPQPPLSWGSCMGLRTGNDGRSPPMPEDISYVKQVHSGEINFVDVQIGHMVRELKRMGIYDQTLLIVTSDHGEEFWDHGRFEHGHTLYDELIRIPLIVKFPADFESSQKVVPTQVRILDIPPTICDVLGIESPDSFVGASLLSLVRGASEDDRLAYSESTLHRANKLAWRDGRYKYIADLKQGARIPEELYDLRADPGEQQNLVEELPALAASLRTDLLAFHEGLVDQAKMLSQPDALDMTPDRIKMLESLGYIR